MAKELKYLFFDTEMSGCDQLVSIGYLLTDSTGSVLNEDYFLIKPHKAIRKSTIAIHGITTAEAKENGITLRRGLARINNAVKDSRVVVGYAPQNDILALAIGCKHIKRDIPFETGETIVVDVARLGTAFMLAKGKIQPGQTPSLIHLYSELFEGETFEEHNAQSDAKATAKCFWKLMQDGWFCYEAILPYAKIRNLCEDKPRKPKPQQEKTEVATQETASESTDDVTSEVEVSDTDVEVSTDDTTLVATKIVAKRKTYKYRRKSHGHGRRTNKKGKSN